MTVCLDFAILAQTPTPWWSVRQAGIFGGLVGGSLLGLWGGLIGAAAGLLLPKGRGRPTVRVLVYSMVAVGLATLIVAIMASIDGQPSFVEQPLYKLGGYALVIGTLAALFFECYLFHKLDRDRLDAEELRRS